MLNQGVLSAAITAPRYDGLGFALVAQPSSTRGGEYEIAKVDVRKEFDELRGKWIDETGGDSSLSRITGNINYLSIIKLGFAAVPLILRDLERTHAPWFVALEAITGVRGFAQKHPGSFRKIGDEWLKWGRDNGYI
jgi:hypothetical protein